MKPSQPDQDFTLSHSAEQIQQLILDNTPQRIFWKNRDLVYQGCNQCFAKDAGLEDPQQIIGKTDFDLPWSNRAEEYRKDDRLVMETDTPQTGYEESAENSTGDIFFTRTSKIPLHDPAGSVDGVLCTYEVVTEYKQAKTELIKHAEQYRAMLATELFGYWLVDISGKLLDVNDTYCRMSGYSREELLQLSVSDLEDIESEEEIARHIKKLVESGVDHFESRHRGKGGCINCVDISAVFLCNQNCFIVFIKDISDRKIVETELQASEERYHAVVNDQTELICRYRSDGTITFVNEAYLHYFKKKRTELINKNFIPHIPEPDLSKSLKRLKKINPRRPLADIEHRVVMPDGVIRWLHWRHRGLYFPDGVLSEYQAVGRDITERKMAEEQLLEQKLFLETLLESTPVPIFFKDRNARYTGFNKSFEIFFGRSLEDLLGKSVYDIAPRELADVYYAKDEELLLNSGSQVYETEVIDAKEIMHNVVIHKAAFLDKNNEIDGLIGVVMDISEHKKALRQMDLNEKRLQLLLELNALQTDNEEEIFAFTLEAVLETVQSQFAFIGFMDEAETVMTIKAWSKGVMTQCTMDYPDLVLPIAEVGLLGECVRQRIPTVVNDYDAPHPRKNGSPVGHVPIRRFLCVPIFDGNRIVAVAAAANKEPEYAQADIDALTLLIEKMFNKIHRLKLEKSLKESKKLLEAVVENIPLMLFLKEATDLRFVMFNRAGEELLGYDRKELLGKNNFDLFPPEQSAHFMAKDREVLGRGAGMLDIPEESILTARNGERLLHTRKVSILGADGASKYLLGISEDITERKWAEDELKQARNDAEVSNKAKSNFLATMSHEIRTPLNALLGNIELLAESELTPQQRERIDDSQAASEMLLQVINDVLDFSKIEAGMLELVNESCSVSELARQLVNVYAASAEQKGLELALSLADGVPDCICADQHRLHQIIANIFSNAIKFTDHGKVSLEIDTDHPLSGPGPDPLILLISVRDTGIGIPLGKQGTLFDSFTQVEEFATRKHSGTGLGLAICRRLAGLMGGTISLTSAPGEGSCFTLALPVVVCQSSQTDKIRRAAASAVTPRNILLADDEELGRNVTVALLQRRGHRVTAVENGAALLEALQREQFDIVLSDISMPDMDGIEVVRIVRSGQRDGINSLIPIIALTAHAFVEDRALFMGYGFNDSTAKPVNFDGLLRQIDDLCRAALSE